MHDIDETLEAFEAGEPDEFYEPEYELEEEDEAAYPPELESSFDELEESDLETAPEFAAPAVPRRRRPPSGLGRRSGRWVRRGNRIVLLGV